jgi:membrane protein
MNSQHMTTIATARTVLRRLRDDEVMVTSSSVAFFVLLAVFPALSAMVALFVLFADPQRIQDVLGALGSILPEGSTGIVADNIQRFAERWTGAQRVPGFAPYLGFAMLLWSANIGTKGLFRGLNRIYRCEEARGLVRFNLVTLLFTLGGVVLLVIALGTILLLPPALDMAGLEATRGQVIRLLRWPLLIMIVSGAIALLYRFGPACADVGWSSVLAGSAVAALLWLGGSLLFSWYVSTLANFSRFYGSLSTVIGFMIWIWLSTVAVLVGAQVDSAIRVRQRRDRGR